MKPNTRFTDDFQTLRTLGGERPGAVLLVALMDIRMPVLL
jgi:hypothetical protein